MVAIAAHRARRSRTESGWTLGISSGSPSTAVPASLGSTIVSVIHQLTRMMGMLAAAMNPQLQSGFTVREGSRICAAFWVNPWSNGSSPEGRKLAEKAPAMPVKAARMPATG